MAGRGAKSLSDRAVFAAIAVWLVSVATGFGLLWKYKSTPGAPPLALETRWPAASRIERDPQHATLLMFVHPRCPCTRASVAELSRLMGRLSGQLAARVVFVRPQGVEDDWERGELWARAASIPGAAAVLDKGGAEAERFDARTSGQVLLYDPAGRLVFSGGITPSRGHEGDSFGQRRIVSLIETGSADRADSPVFGCALRASLQSANKEER